MDGVIEMANVDHPHGHTDEGDDLEDRGMCETVDIKWSILSHLKQYQVLHFYNMNK